MTTNRYLCGLPHIRCIFLAISAMTFDHVNGADSSQLSQVFLRLYTGKTMGEYTDKFVAESADLLPSMDRTKPTVLFIYGYTGTLQKEAAQLIIGAYLERQDHNTIAVDWEKIAAENYVAAAFSVSEVGAAVAKALDRMVNSGLDKNSLHVVGHSMGAQISGFVGRNVNFTLPRITGLDPAGPGFTVIINHLQASDAKFVDVIHTDQGFYGNVNTGTVDFYPNGGTRYQPGCPTLNIPLSDDSYCSHHRAYVFYAESLMNKKAFVGVNCGSYEEFKGGNCGTNEKVVMGYGTPETAKGYFYLETANKSPYGRGLAGTEPSGTS